MGVVSARSAAVSEDVIDPEVRGAGVSADAGDGVAAVAGVAAGAGVAASAGASGLRPVYKCGTGAVDQTMFKKRRVV